MASNSSVRHGLNTCLETLLLEPRVLLHQLTPSKQDSSSTLPRSQIPFPRTENPKIFPTEKVQKSNKNSGKIWNFTESVTNTSFDCRKTDNKKQRQVYVHHLDKSSDFSLSLKSLEMCTESLGCETGSGIDTSKEEYAYLLLKKQNSSIKKKPITRKVKHISNFPPPLSSISGNDSVQMMTHREGGRLVIKAFTCSSSCSYFKTERKNGRLRLSLPKPDNDEVNEEEEEEAFEIKKSCMESDYETKADFGFLMEEQIKEDEGKIGCKLGNGEWSSSRCSGDRNGNIVKLPFCVAIS